MKTYYIVEEMYHGDKWWRAYNGSLFGKVTNFWLSIPTENSWISADDCENKLRIAVASKDIAPKIVRTVKI